MYPGNRREEDGEHGPIYMAVERALWALGPALLLLMLLGQLSAHSARQRAETEMATQIASENNRLCEKWGMPPGSPEHVICVRDLIGVRADTEQRLRDENAAAF